MRSEVLPHGWKRTSLKSLIDGDGLLCDGDWVESKDQSPDGGVRLIQLADIGDGSYLDKSSRFLTRDKAASLGCTYLQCGDILVARMPDPIGRACIFPGDVKPSVTAVDVCIVRVNGKINKRWLLAAINSSSTRRFIEKKSAGSTRTRISSRELAALKLPVPPKAQQDQIAVILDAIDDAIEATQAVIQQTRQLKIALLQDLLTNGLPGKKKAFKEIAFVGKVPRHWKLTSLSEVAVEGRGNFVNGPFGSDLLTSDFVPEGVPVLYIQDIQSGAFRRVSNVYVTEKKARELDFCSIVPGDVLITKVGDPPCIAAVYPASEPNAIITQDVIRIRPNRRVVDPLFLKTVLNSRIGKTQVRRILLTGTRDRVSLGDFKRVATLLPPLEEQREISRLTESIDKRLDKTQLYSSHLALTKVALSQGLLTGRIPVTGGEGST